MLRVICLSLIVLGTLQGVEWPEFRGLSGMGVIEGRVSPEKIDFKKDLIWECEIPGKGWSSPVMSGNTLVVTTAVGEADVELRVIALDANSGQIKWNQLVFEPTAEELGALHEKNSFASSTPFLSEGIVFAHFGHMGTAALSLNDGAILWRYHEPYSAKHGNGGSPVLVDGNLVFSADGEDRGLLRALNAQTGKKAWEYDRKKDVRQKFSFGTPLVVNTGGEKQIISQGSGMVGGFDPENGHLIWSVDYGAGYSVVPRPFFKEEIVYVATGFNRPKLLAIDLKGAQGDVTKSHVKWSAARDIPKTPSFVISGQEIYLVEDAGRLTCLDLETGERLWMEQLRRKVSSSLTLVGDQLLTFTEEGQGFVHRVSRQGATLIAENDYGEPIFASPIILDRSLIVRSEKRIRKLGRE